MRSSCRRRVKLTFGKVCDLFPAQPPPSWGCFVWTTPLKVLANSCHTASRVQSPESASCPNKNSDRQCADRTSGTNDVHFLSIHQPTARWAFFWPDRLDGAGRTPAGGVGQIQPLQNRGAASASGSRVWSRVPVDVPTACREPSGAVAQAVQGRHSSAGHLAPQYVELRGVVGPAHRAARASCASMVLSAKSSRSAIMLRSIARHPSAVAGHGTRRYGSWARSESAALDERGHGVVRPLGDQA